MPIMKVTRYQAQCDTCGEFADVSVTLVPFPWSVETVKAPLGSGDYVYEHRVKCPTCQAKEKEEATRRE